MTYRITVISQWHYHETAPEQISKHIGYHTPRYKKTLGRNKPLTSLTATILPDLYVGRRLWEEGRVQSRHLAILVARLRFIRRYCPAFRLSLLLMGSGAGGRSDKITSVAHGLAEVFLGKPNSVLRLYEKGSFHCKEIAGNY